MEGKRVEIFVPEREYPQNKEGKSCDCMNREYLLKYKKGVLHWCKQPGDSVLAGECICEAEIEKKIFEVPTPVAGILESCCVEEDAEFSCKQVLGYILSDV